MRLFKRLARWSEDNFSVNSGDRFNLREVAKSDGGHAGGYLDLRRIIFEITSDFNDGTVTGLNMRRWLSRILLNVPNIGNLVDLQGTDVDRLYYARHGHPVDATPADTAGTASQTRRWRYVIDFTSIEGVDKGDTEIPIAALRDATLQVFVPAAADIDANISGNNSNTSVDCYLELVTRREQAVPVLQVLEADTLGTDRERSLPLKEGVYTHILLCPDANTAWATGDWNDIRVDSGNVELHRGGITNQRHIIEQLFNSLVYDRGTLIDPPIDSSGDLREFIPLVHPGVLGSGPREGAHQATYDAVPADQNVKFTYTGTSTRTARYIQRRLLRHNERWTEYVRASLGIPAGHVFLPKSGSKKPPSDVDSALLMRLKDYGPGR